MDDLESEREWVIFIKGELRDAEKREETPSPCIFMASSPLRGLKLEAFIPQVVAIGPLHSDVGPHHSSFPENRETERYKMIAAAEMETHKVMAAHHLAQSLPNRDFGILADAVFRDISLARAQYDAVIGCKSDEKLAYLLALDAAFIVEVLRCSAYDLTSGFSSYYCRRFPRPLRKSILQDFVLLENQVPLFLLLKALQMDQKCTSDEDALRTLGHMVSEFASEILPFTVISEESFSSVVHNMGEKKHLLDCLYGIVTHDTGSRGSSPRKLQLEEKPTHVPPATDLWNCGVQIKPVEPGNMSSVRFDARRAILYVPKIRVGDDTERLLRNLIAYESHLIDKVQVLSYLRFMNGLVDTAEDVALLVEKCIIAQDIGSNDMVAKMWNNLCVNTMRVCTQEYEEVAVQLVRHRNFKLNALKAEFKRTYLARPWLVISVLSAAALLIMTFLITFYTVKLYLAEG
ncbi:hypothetical protein L7F22_055226 [Adiantum nelumboides]|nr:hypothetical protein [Adiantum nelumboides]